MRAEEQLKLAYMTIAELKDQNAKLVDAVAAQISALAASGKVNAGKLYGRKSEKSSRLNKRRDDDEPPAVLLLPVTGPINKC